MPHPLNSRASAPVVALCASFLWIASALLAVAQPSRPSTLGEKVAAERREAAQASTAQKVDLNPFGSDTISWWLRQPRVDVRDTSDAARVVVIEVTVPYCGICSRGHASLSAAAKALASQGLSVEHRIFSVFDCDAMSGQAPGFGAPSRRTDVTNGVGACDLMAGIVITGTNPLFADWVFAQGSTLVGAGDFAAALQRAGVSVADFDAKRPAAVTEIANQARFAQSLQIGSFPHFLINGGVFPGGGSERQFAEIIEFESRNPGWWKR